MAHEPEPSAERLAWRCRRGMKELDILLQRWLRRDFPRASDSERRLFAQLLELPDPQLAAYLLGGEPAGSEELRGLLRGITAASVQLM
jgi:antitoxin CptB